MPTVRYLIRNEYGLSDPDLYQLADKDDPEAVLEGVAMAGLVGVLRQLGDLAEFAAKIFHDLHEEVTSTGARGHGLMLRVQQLEAEFPSIEKGLLVQSSHSQFAYNDGMDWNTNLRTDQNLITQGDMPRFILDSYEESRGPPRLFMLDKFDIAGAGACLKRYSDPSFFKLDYASTGKMEEEMHMEIKHTKIKKKAHWKKGETIESFLEPLINSNLQPDQVSAKVPFRRVKLKCRKLLDSDIASKKSYMEQFLEACSAEEKVLPQTFASHPPEIIKSIDSAQLIPEAYGTIVKNINDSSTARKINPSQSPRRKEKTVDNSSKFMNQPEIESKGSLKYYTIEDEYSFDEAKKSAIENIQANINKSLANSNSSPDHEYGEPDDIGSDLENYVDALNTIQSEVERDTKNKIMPHQKLELDTTGFVTWDQKQHTETSPPKERDSMTEVERSSSNSDISNDPTDTQDFSKPDMPNITHNEVLDNDKVEEYSLSNHLLLNWGPTYEIDMTSKDHSNIEVEQSPSSSDVSNDPTDNQKYLKPEMPDKTDNEFQDNDKVNEHALSNHLLPNWGSTNETVIASKDNCNVEDHCSIENTLVSPDCKVVEPCSFANNTTNFKESIPLSEAKESYTARNRSADSVGDDEYVEGRVFNHILQTMYQNNNENIHVQLLGESAVETIESSPGRVSLSDSGNDDGYLVGEDIDHISEATCPNDNVDVHVQPLEESTAGLVKETQGSVNGIEQSISLAEASDDDKWKPWEVPHTDDAVSTEAVKDSSNLSDNLLLIPDTHGSYFIKDVEATISSDTEMKEENVYEDVLAEHIEESNVQQDSLPDTREQNNKTCVDAITHDNIFTVVEGNAVADDNDNIGETYNDMAEDVIKEIKPDINIDGTKEFNDQLFQENLMPTTDKLQLPLTNSSETDGHHNNSVDDNPFESENFSYAEVQTQSLESNLGSADLLDSTNFIVSGEMQLHNELSSCIENYEAENQKENMLMEFPTEVPLDGLEDENPSIVASTDSEILENRLPLDYVNMEFQNKMQEGSNDELVAASNDAEDPKESANENSTEHLPFYSMSRISEEESQNKEFSCTLIGENKSDSGTSELAGCKLVKQADNDSLDEYVIVDSDENNQSTHSEYSIDDARFEIKLEENYMPCDAVLSRHCTEDEESCNPNKLDPLTKCEPQPSIISSNETPVENLIGPDNSPTEPDNGNENMICSTENEQDSILEKLENQENNHFVVLDGQLERPCIRSNDLTASQNAMEQLLKPEHSEYFEVDNIRSNPELSIHENPGLPSTVNSNLQDSDETPPLPPLPPIEWIGNPRFVPQSLINDTIQYTVNDTSLPTDATDSIIEQTMSDEKHSQANDVDKKINYQFSKEDLDASSSSTQEATHVEDQTIKHGLHKRPQLAQLLPTFKLEISQHEASSSAGDPVMPVNPYFVGPYTEEWRHQYGYGFYGSESVQNLNLPPYGFLYPIGGDASAVYNYMIPTIDGENSNLKYRSIRDRPRDPLIEAVAAHDKSKLRKVSELDLPSTKPKEDDRNSLLEEIKNKSFNLKPANAIKPNFKGVPPANLKVAAILEKANAIRKACAESDEDDCDSWSDS